MKADKYGLPASEADKIIERHFVVNHERKLLDDLHFAYAMRVGPGLAAALGSVGQQ